MVGSVSPVVFGVVVCGVNPKRRRGGRKMIMKKKRKRKGRLILAGFILGTTGLDTSEFSKRSTSKENDTCHRHTGCQQQAAGVRCQVSWG